MFTQSVILRYARQAGDHAKSTVDLVKERLAADTEARWENKKETPLFFKIRIE